MCLWKLTSKGHQIQAVFVSVGAQMRNRRWLSTKAASVSPDMANSEGHHECSIQTPVSTSLTSDRGSTYSVILPGPPTPLADPFKMSRLPDKYDAAKDGDFSP